MKHLSALSDQVSHTQYVGTQNNDIAACDTGFLSLSKSKRRRELIQKRVLRCDIIVNVLNKLTFNSLSLQADRNNHKDCFVVRVWRTPRNHDFILSFTIIPKAERHISIL